ncbi:MAG TPA: RrF2 family transcriptional regulator [Gemmatimonadales bacterium]|jgi:Rrf2 family protein|nr:RrF2 family transcriptional regulator [Gemmatimonadales bacterium]
MLSQTAEYALRTVLYLAAEKQDTLFRVSEIAEDLDVPRNYLSKTLHQLAKAGILTSSRGKHGGFRLTKAPSRITLAEVVAPFNGPTGARICLLGRTACSDSDPCPAHGKWKRVSGEVSTFFRETTVGDLLEGPAARVPRKRAGAR